jgi:peroxiredoxin
MSIPKFLIFPAAAIAAMALCCLVISGCSKKEEPQLTVRAAPTGGGDNVTEVSTVAKRAEKAPNFSWKDSTGKTVDLDSFHGTVTLVNFWATWCGPCKRELPDLISLSREMDNRKVKFIGVSTDRGPNTVEDVRTFVKDRGIPYQVLIANDDLEDAFGNPRAIPTTFIIDANGKIAQTIVGMRTKEFFAQAITSLLQ